MSDRGLNANSGDDARRDTPTVRLLNVTEEKPQLNTPAVPRGGAAGHRQKALRLYRAGKAFPLRPRPVAFGIGGGSGEGRYARASLQAERDE